MPSIRWNLRPRWGEIVVDRHGRGATGGEGSGWTRIDLATGSRQPAFGGLAGVGELSLSADGQTLASLHTAAPPTLNWAENRME